MTRLLSQPIVILLVLSSLAVNGFFNKPQGAKFQSSCRPILKSTFPFAFRSQLSRVHLLRDGNKEDLGDGSVRGVDSPTLKELFGTKGVQFYNAGNDDYLKREEDKEEGYIFSSSPSKTITKVRMDIPMMPFSAPLFPNAKEMLHVYEMKYRSLMNDAESKFNSTLGRCYVSESGSIGLVGSLCRIKEQKKMSDGQGFYIIESFSRFRVLRIKQSSPYILAEVELDFNDESPSLAETQVNERLCSEVYVLLKMYLRLARLQVVSEDGKGMIEISNALKAALPGQQQSLTSVTEFDYGAQRHTDFSHACAQMLATDPALMQQLLQSSSTMYRLHGIKRVLEEAVSELSSLLLDDEMLAEEELYAIREAAETGDDEDLMPSTDCDGVRIDDELTTTLSFDLALNNLDARIFSFNDHDEEHILMTDLESLHLEEEDAVEGEESSSEGMQIDEEDLWGQDLQPFQ